jgi:predicted peptidase
MKFFTLIVCSFLVSFIVKAQDLSLFQKHSFIHNGDTMPYRLLLPKNFDPNKKYPLYLFLHGSGERGNDNELQLVHGAKMFLRDSVRENYPAIVVFPQCSADSYWSNVKFGKDEKGARTFEFQKDGEPTKAMRLLLNLLSDLNEKYKLNKHRRYIAGLSMGGMGTFELVRRKPKYFAAAVPICGGAHPETAQKLNKVAWRIFHGGKDNVVPPEFSQVMVNALQQNKASVLFKLYPNATHNSWDSAFAEPDYLSWIFSKKK